MNSISTTNISKSPVRRMVADTLEYWGCLRYFARGGSYEACPYFSDRRQAKVQVRSLALILQLWNEPHYRNGTFQEDMIKNLRNVAVPGTGVPLSLLCYNKLIFQLCLLILYPLCAFVAALLVGRGNFCEMASAYSTQLLCPQDWFSFWRLNCRLATFHSSVTGSTDYRIEDKWDFLKLAISKNVPVSPIMKVPKIVVKHRNEEGGMGIHFFANAVSDSTTNGEWIIQECLTNADGIARLLPQDAPLSTLRVITASWGGLSKYQSTLRVPTSAAAKTADTPPKEIDGCAVDNSDSWSPATTPYNTDDMTPDNSSDDESQTARAHENVPVKALSCVFRAGCAGAATDHVAMLFDVDMETGEIKRGTTNNHWYKLGLHHVTTNRKTIISKHDITHHPDTDKEVTGKQIPDIGKIVNLVETAHKRMAPGVPLVGWDVALAKDSTGKEFMCLLEGNLSCNFFRGTFDQGTYFKFVEEYITDLEKQQALKKSL